MNVSSLAAVLGNLPETVGMSRDYFLTRGCFIDARGPLQIDATSVWGFGVRVLTRSHDIGSGAVGKVVARGVVVEAGAWVGSFATLYNCRIGQGSIVAAGAVVASCDVAPGVIVAGNPAAVIARWDGHVRRWRYLEPRRGLLS